jgi:transposase
MGRKLHPETLRRVIIDLSAGRTLRGIAKDLRVGRNTVRRIELSLDLYGEPYPPASVVRGRPRLLLAAQERVSENLDSISHTNRSLMCSGLARVPSGETYSLPG